MPLSFFFFFFIAAGQLPKMGKSFVVCCTTMSSRGRQSRVDEIFYHVTVPSDHFNENINNSDQFVVMLRIMIYLRINVLWQLKIHSVAFTCINQSHLYWLDSILYCFCVTLTYYFKCIHTGQPWTSITARPITCPVPHWLHWKYKEKESNTSTSPQTVSSVSFMDHQRSLLFKTKISRGHCEQRNGRSLSGTMETAGLPAMRPNR